VPYLQQVYGMSRVTPHSTPACCCSALPSVRWLIGVISDRLRSRHGVMRAFVVAYTLSWLPWLAQVSWPMWATLAWFF
jgi:nitrate/nitrite transporter NarK